MLSNNGIDHHKNGYSSQPRGFLTPPPTWKTRPYTPSMSASEKKPRQPQTDPFHVIHKVPSGDSPYVRAKHVQLIDKDPSKAISLFWAAINSGDRVDSALKDMAVVMKQLDRSDEAVEAIKSFRHLCPLESQESLDNILVELYKQSGRTDEEIEMLQLKLKQVEEGMSFGGKRKRIARSQGKKVQITVEKEYSRLLGNLAWVYMQKKDFKSAEEHYRKALSLESDRNKQCNLAICLMHMNKLTEAKFLLQAIRASSENIRMDESYAKSYERASQMLNQVMPFDANDGVLLSSPSPLTADRMNNKAFTEFPYEKRADFDWRRDNNRLKGVYESRFSNRAIPKVPFTQPRRCLWSGGQSKGRLTETSCRKLSFGPSTGRENAHLLADRDINSYCSTVIKECELPSDKNSGQCNDEEENKNIRKQSEHKMSWADMVEEDERKFGNWRNDDWRKAPDEFSFGSLNQERSNDENLHPNNVPETPNNLLDQLSQDLGMVDLGSGYLTQPVKNNLSTNSSVRRSLCFDQNQNAVLENNNNNSPLPMKVLNFEGQQGLVVSVNFGPDKSTKPRNRLQVFKDITT